MNKTVNFLKDLIMANKPSFVKDGDGDASHLNLWEVVDVPIADFLPFIEPPTKEPLNNATSLSTLFQPVVRRRFLHVVAQVVPRRAPGRVPQHETPQHEMRILPTLNESECFFPLDCP